MFGVPGCTGEALMRSRMDRCSSKGEPVSWLERWRVWVPILFLDQWSKVGVAQVPFRAYV